MPARLRTPPERAIARLCLGQTLKDAALSEGIPVEILEKALMPKNGRLRHIEEYIYRVGVLLGEIYSLYGDKVDAETICLIEANPASIKERLQHIDLSQFDVPVAPDFWRPGMRSMKFWLGFYNGRNAGMNKSSRSHAWKSIDISRCIEAPPPVDYLFSGMPARGMGLQIAPAGTDCGGWHALQVASAVAGADTMSLGTKKPSQVSYVTNLPAQVIHEKIHILGKILTSHRKSLLSNNLKIFHSVEEDFTKIAHKGEYLSKLMNSTASSELVVIDQPLHIEQDLDSERKYIKRLAHATESIAHITGSAILVVFYSNWIDQLLECGDITDGFDYVTVASRVSAEEIGKHHDQGAIANDLVKIETIKPAFLRPISRSWFLCRSDIPLMRATVTLKK